MKVNKAISVESDDTYLLKRIQSSCKQSFDILYDRYWEMAFSGAFKRLKDEEQSKDIVQEIFTYIWFKRETLQIDNLGAYINVAVRNRVLKILENQKLSHPFFKVLENLPQLENSPDSPMLEKELLHSLENLLNTLSTRKQMIYRLRYQEDLGTKDIARLLRISRKTVQNQLARAIEQLRITLLLLLISAITIVAA